MGKTFLFNDTDAPKIMGGKLVPPGEGREVDDFCLQPGEGPEPAADAGAPQADLQADLQGNLQDLLAKPLKELVPLLADFGDETLAELQGLEQLRDTPRTTLLAKIAELQLTRAQAKTGGAAT